ncbi:MAG: hypothetical protein H0T42_21545 [Deltaproteobacteria bacterium]|nr:hypothetical protein [Deltaproteobacteria bacterium]
MSSDRARWLLLAIAALVLVGHSLAYDFVTDDAYISFVYSRNLAEHGELSFNLGQPVEGYTSFLWTVILGLGMVAGIPPEWSSRVLATVCAVLTLLVVFRLVERALGRKTPWATVPPLLLAASSGFACWTSGGLETQLFTLLVVVAIDGVVDAVQHPGAIRRAGIALAFAAMTRPEGLLVAGVLGIVHLTSIVQILRAERRMPSIRNELLAIACFLALWAPWFAWRYWYYGHLWPNTYYVKAAGRWSDPKFGLEMYRLGAHYLWVWLTQTRLLYALPLALLGMVVGRARTPRFVLAMSCLLLAAAYLPYVVTVGGDFMGLHRFIMPMFVVAAITVTLGLEFLSSLAGNPARLGPIVASVLVGAFVYPQAQLTRESLRFGNFANDRGIDTPAFLIVYTQDRAAIGKAMAPCFAPDDFSIVGGAGAQPYYGRMRAIDVFGLVSERIAHEEPRIRARAGHTKFGSDSLLASYDPTFVFSCYQIHATPAQPRLPCAGFWLGRGYEQVTMRIPGMRQQGEYYTFLAKKARAFQCPGRVP